MNHTIIAAQGAAEERKEKHMKTDSGVTKLLLAVLLTVVLSGCASSMMLPTDTLIQPGPDYAVVNFLRPSSFGGAIKFGIWDSDNFVGVLTPKNYIQYKAAPGEHLFMARAENWAVIKANVAAGKTYYIVGAPRMGAWKARVALEVVNPDDPKLQKWMTSLRPTMVDPAQKDAYMAERVDDVRHAVKNVQNGSASYDEMRASDGK
jgi:hypothetical protein